MPFIGKRHLGRTGLGKILNTFSANWGNAYVDDYGKPWVRLLGAAQYTGGWNATTVPALDGSAVIETPNVIATAAYTSAGTGDKDGIAFWGNTSANGGNWWAVYPYQTSSTSSTSNCTGGTTASCLAASGIGSSSTSTCTPTGCGTGCTTTCTTYTFVNSGGSGNYNISAGACGTVSVFIPGGSTGFARCCECNTGGTTTTTTYRLYVQYVDGTLSGGLTANNSDQIASRTTSAYSVGGMKVDVSGNSITTTLYSNTSLATSIGTPSTYLTIGATKGSLVGLYSIATGNTDTATFTATPQ